MRTLVLHILHLTVLLKYSFIITQLMPLLTSLLCKVWNSFAVLSVLIVYLTRVYRVQHLGIYWYRYKVIEVMQGEELMGCIYYSSKMWNIWGGSDVHLWVLFSSYSIEVVKQIGFQNKPIKQNKAKTLLKLARIGFVATKESKSSWYKPSTLSRTS